ncbi:mediator of RNA polymerase II transcription subunit 14 [Aspergillus eucalypticola CBS 122712]|uniref:Mediator of RNA polymerase II transcription subunit 14 n=1 Tax=Aspergillus eucalypticola (strain CBS 122712 / IBT 29274) TaxID=1448314 RepID=A0A317UM07_ASPEC|nr:mediator of RNA polymerase II transcription subunit 14 [Aspergillus eucalypticola CBS 122712]PWY62993.1 mediator of RNA polymerase II transcription subunit 14 [Aspergillus eucalypticola CBS 122712]
MPGVVMDNANIGGLRHGPGNTYPQDGLSHPRGEVAQFNGANAQDGPVYVNGVEKNASQTRSVETVSANHASRVTKGPPELPHITQGFFPFAKLVNRSVQQCWNDLSDLITEMAEMQVNSHEFHPPTAPTTGKSPGNQSPGNIRKKLRILEFSHAKRAEFIKLLVLSQWSRQAADVSKLIDIQNFIRTRHQAYMNALQWVGDMKRDLVQAQVANPDLKTALEVLSRGKVASMSDFGYKPPRRLTVRGTLRKLQKINRLIGARLVVQEEIPPPFRDYRVHDGRVTFSVPGEFELDLSIGEENENSQFFFVDIRFLFSPSPPVLKGRLLNELEMTINDVLQNSGLTGCFDLLHNLVLTNKVNILFKQATELARGSWSEGLRVELLHRTLVVQYWTLKPGAKSWLEIGIRRGHRKSDSESPGLPSLKFRWMRDGGEVPCEDIAFDAENLSMEVVLRSVIALHVSHILSSAYNKIKQSSLFSTGFLSLRAHLTRTEPGDCQLDAQLTETRHLRVSIEPMSGMSILSATPTVSDRSDLERNPERSSVEDIVSRVARIRCNAAIEEIESKVKMLGFVPLNPRAWKVDIRRIFPPNVLRFTLFSHQLWGRNWIVAATSSMDGDSWWVVQLRTTVPAKGPPVPHGSGRGQSVLRSAQVVTDSFFPARYDIDDAYLANLGHSLSGILAIHSNARYLSDLQSIKFHPPPHKLMIEPDLRVPDILVRYDVSTLPSVFRAAMPVKAKKKSLIRDTIRLAFHGVDPREKCAIMVAYGNLVDSAAALGPLISSWDRSLVFQKGGSGFAMRLLAPAGHPVIASLLENLQRLECVLSVLESLQRKKVEIRTFSLSSISFVYGPERDLAASLNIHLSRNESLMELSPTELASRSESLFGLRLGIQFGLQNPHRRIQESLASSLNRSSTEAGLETVVELLTLTLPLMRALDQLMASTSYSGPLRLHVTVRNARTYQIHYPGDEARFQLVAASHQNRSVWVLKDANNQGNSKNDDSITARLRQTLYTSKGDGWKGLETGVVVEVNKVGILLRELEKCFAASRADPKHDPADSAANFNGSNKPGTSASEAEKGTADGAKFSLSDPLTTLPNDKSTLSQADTAAQKEDIIMID